MQSCLIAYSIYAFPCALILLGDMTMRQWYYIPCFPCVNKILSGWRIRWKLEGSGTHLYRFCLEPWTRGRQQIAGEQSREGNQWRALKKCGGGTTAPPFFTKVKPCGNQSRKSLRILTFASEGVLLCGVPGSSPRPRRCAYQLSYHSVRNQWRTLADNARSTRQRWRCNRIRTDCDTKPHAQSGGASGVTCITPCR